MADLTSVSRILRIVYYIIFVILWNMVEGSYPLFVKFLNSMAFYAFLFISAHLIERWRIKSNETPR